MLAALWRRWGAGVGGCCRRGRGVRSLRFGDGGARGWARAAGGACACGRPFTSDHGAPVRVRRRRPHSRWACRGRSRLIARRRSRVWRATSVCRPQVAAARRPAYVAIRELDQTVSSTKTRELDQRAGPPREPDHPASRTPASWTPHPPQAGHVRCETRGFPKLHNTRPARGGGVCCSLRVEAAVSASFTTHAAPGEGVCAAACGWRPPKLGHRPHEARAPTSQTSRTDLTKFGHRPHKPRAPTSQTSHIDLRLHAVALPRVRSPSRGDSRARPRPPGGGRTADARLSRSACPDSAGPWGRRHP